MGFQHVTANLLMWLALALPLEYAYGSPRILAVWLISAFGSSLFAAAFQAECTLVSSAKHAVLTNQHYMSTVPAVKLSLQLDLQREAAWPNVAMLSNCQCLCTFLLPLSRNLVTAA